MALRDWLKKSFGEETIRAFERAVSEQVFGDKMFPCPACHTPVPDAYVAQKGVCPVCRTPASGEFRRQCRESMQETDRAESAQLKRQKKLDALKLPCPACKAQVSSEHVFWKGVCPACGGTASAEFKSLALQARLDMDAPRG